MIRWIHGATLTITDLHAERLAVSSSVVACQQFCQKIVQQQFYFVLRSLYV
ncbi:MAG: hypothetical protein K8L91_26140 [Anaerolineae bacterium]|nr:hypothetical protein [Anaerolineae bacterium]